MPTLASLPTLRRCRLTTERFPGLDRRGDAPEGSLEACTNLSSRLYPLCASRSRRGVFLTLSDPGGLIEKDALCYVSAGGLYINHTLTALTGLSSGEKQLVSMGAYLLIFPDRMYYNTADPTDYGSMEARYSATGAVTYTPCDREGRAVSVIYSADEPEEPENGDLWTEGTGLWQYSRAQESWSAVQGYVKLTFSTQGRIPALFSVTDGVSLGGTEGLDGSHVLTALGGGEEESDFIVLPGLLWESSTETATVTLTRTVPAMDYVCQSGNRLWGCRYGRNAAGEVVNELYASALGDFKNWNRFEGLSTDSWRASVGSDGVWTGAVNYLGSPVFFKENTVHRITVSAIGAHAVSEMKCRGVQKGCYKSLRVVGDVLYYKSPRDVCAWQGGFPQSVSLPLGEESGNCAAAGALGERYYLSMENAEGLWSLYVYDTVRDIWYREDDLHAVSFAAADGDLWCLDGDGRLLSLTGQNGTAEEEISWSGTSRLFHYSLPERKYLGRVSLRMSLERGKRATLAVEYDSSGVWETIGTVTGTGLTGSFTLPLLPRRCDHFRLRLSGSGEVRLYSVSRQLETGSEW